MSKGNLVDNLYAGRSEVTMPEPVHNTGEIWLPEPSGKLCSKLIFRQGGALSVEGSVGAVTELLNEAVRENEQAYFINPYYGTTIVVRHPDEVIIVNTDWADMDSVKLATQQAERAKLEARKALSQR